MTDAELVIDGGMIGGTRPGGAEVDGLRISLFQRLRSATLSGKFHSNISMEDSAKLALLANRVVNALEAWPLSSVGQERMFGGVRLATYRVFGGHPLIEPWN
jgi:hypothetical protein